MPSPPDYKITPYGWGTNALNVLVSSPTAPLPPLNVNVTSPFLTGTLDIRWDDPSLQPNNSAFTIVGVNIYRATDSELGPYTRINTFPQGGGFYRDTTDTIPVSGEGVSINQFTSFGTDGAGRFVFKTQCVPIVKDSDLNITADSPMDVAVTIDGITVPVQRVFGTTGEIEFVTAPTYDPCRQRTIPALLPTLNPDGTLASDIRVSYKTNRIISRAIRPRIFYRVVAVALDASTPSGYIEGDLTQATPVTVLDVERLDYIWREAIRRNRWILQQGGERVKVFIRRSVGVPCPNHFDPFGVEITKRNLQDCPACYGTSFLGGFDGPFETIIAPDDSERRITQTNRGKTMEHDYEVWTGPSPMLSQRDFIVKQTNERYSIGPVRSPNNRGNRLQQHFQIGFLDLTDIKYQVPVTGMESLGYPETRYPELRGETEQSYAQITDKETVPEERRQRGRSGVWENIQYAWPLFVLPWLGEVLDAVSRFV